MRDIINVISVRLSVYSEVGYGMLLIATVMLCVAIYNLTGVKKAGKLGRISEPVNFKRNVNFKRYYREEVRERKRWLPDIGNLDKIEKKLTQSGSNNLLIRMGMSKYNYYAVKFSFASLSGASTFDFKFIWNTDWKEFLMYFIMGYVMPDLLLSMSRRKRQNAMKEVMEKVLETTVNGLSMGYTPIEVMAALKQEIPETNPLYPEINRLSTQIVKGNLRIALDEFRARIGLEEINSYCFALMHYDLGGNPTVMLKQQYDSLIRTNANKSKSQTYMRGNLSSLAVALVVGALIIIIFIPFMARFSQLAI